ncbi:hypothetical protein D3C87_1801740 [compost metagenome]
MIFAPFSSATAEPIHTFSTEAPLSTVTLRSPSFHSTLAPSCSAPERSGITVFCLPAELESAAVWLPAAGTGAAAPAAPAGTDRLDTTNKDKDKSAACFFNLHLPSRSLILFRSFSKCLIKQ